MGRYGSGGGNSNGAKWTKGGAKKRNTLQLNTSGLEKLIITLDELNGKVQEAVTDALMQASETVRRDTIAALEEQYLPAQGKFSSGDTKKAVVTPSVEWHGTVAEAPVGFDYGENGAGGFLITGTPRMQPDPKLADIYTRKQYMSRLQKDMQNIVGKYIVDAMEGKK